MSKRANSNFGLTLVVRSFYAEQRETLSVMDTHRIVLESDAPFFAPNGEPRGHPQYLGEVAITEVKGGPEGVLWQSTLNAKALYG